MNYLGCLGVATALVLAQPAWGHHSDARYDQGSVIERPALKQICAVSAFGGESCRAGWSVNEAARYVCQASPGNVSARSQSSAATGVAGSASGRAAQPATSQRPIRVRRNSAGRPMPPTR